MDDIDRRYAAATHRVMDLMQNGDCDIVGRHIENRLDPKH